MGMTGATRGDFRDAHATYLDLFFRELEFPTSPLVKSHPGRWSSNCVGFRGLGPATSVPACEDRDVAPGRLGPTMPRFTRIASSAETREEGTAGAAACVARNGPERRAVFKCRCS